MAATAITLVASAEKTGDGVGSAVDVTNLGGTLRLTLAVTKNSDRDDALLPGAVPLDAPSFAVHVETSADGSTNWRTLLATAEDESRFTARRFTDGPTVRTERRTFPGADNFVRARWTIKNGRGRLTFALTGTVI